MNRIMTAVSAFVLGAVLILAWSQLDGSREASIIIMGWIAGIATVLLSASHRLWPNEDS